VGSRRGGDPRVSVISQSAGGARAQPRYRGRFVAFLDSDNTWTTDFLRLTTATMLRDGHQVGHAGVRGDRDDRVWYRGESGASTN